MIWVAGNGTTPSLRCQHPAQSRIDGVDEAVEEVHHFLDLLGVTLDDQFLRLGVMSDARIGTQKTCLW